MTKQMVAAVMRQSLFAASLCLVAAGAWGASLPAQAAYGPQSAPARLGNLRFAVSGLARLVVAVLGR